METELKKYVRVNFVEAKPMTRWDYNVYRGWNVSAAPDEEGYILFYRKGKPDEYVSWCPKKQFDEVSHLADSMTFGEAIEAMKQGHKVTRKGWNGKGMYLWLVRADVYDEDECVNDPHLDGCLDANKQIRALPYICMRTADGSLLQGWLASQTDMLSTDWHIVP